MKQLRPIFSTFCIILLLCSFQGTAQNSIIVEFTRPMVEAKSFAVKSIDGSCSIGNQTFDQIAQEEEFISIQPVFRSDPRHVERERNMGMDLFYRIQYHPKKSANTICQRLVAEFGVQSAEIEEAFPVQSMSPNDSKYNQQWYLKGRRAGHIDIQAEAAWEISTGDPRVIVAIIDGSVETEHEDLVSNRWVNTKEDPYNGLDDDNNGYVDDAWGWNFVGNNNDCNPESTSEDHGSHVAGAVAAQSNNGIGVAGVAGGWNDKPGARLMMFRTGKINPEDGREYIYYGYDALKYAADNDAAIAQCSWGGGSVSSAGRKAVEYFTQHGGGDVMNGGLVIVAAGNDNEDVINYPACYPDVLSVGSVNQFGDRSSFSNYGDWVLICAPGEAIHSTIPFGRYGNMDGTSMACPVVSGVAALVLSITADMPKDTKTPQWLSKLLIDNANYDNTNSSIGPRVDALLAAQAAKTFATSTKPSIAKTKQMLSSTVVNQSIQIRGVESQAWNVRIINNAGQVLIQKSAFGSSFEVPVHTLNTGLYILELHNGDALHYTERFLKQ